MFILFGSKQTKKELALGRELLCPRCNNVRRWPVMQYTTWFSVFFIPVIPLKNQYFEMCPICKAGKKLTRQWGPALFRSLQVHNTDEGL